MHPQRIPQCVFAIKDGQETIVRLSTSHHICDTRAHHAQTTALLMAFVSEAHQLFLQDAIVILIGQVLTAPSFENLLCFAKTIAMVLDCARLVTVSTTRASWQSVSATTTTQEMTAQLSENQPVHKDVQVMELALPPDANVKMDTRVLIVH